MLKVSVAARRAARRDWTLMLLDRSRRLLIFPTFFGLVERVLDSGDADSLHAIRLLKERWEEKYGAVPVVAEAVAPLGQQAPHDGQIVPTTVPLSRGSVANPTGTQPWRHS
ncbi:hypothetical protein Salat_2427700 [Sesamum alatum]|uniref:Uncharacterized protein n=1 Tax=Sesamum alatum TaxID=300844 RepID=A0AAE1XZ56_9LAMI|nr:hypothetical protein Salat_2427700 [Sesamum alatum]